MANSWDVVSQTPAPKPTSSPATDPWSVVGQTPAQNPQTEQPAPEQPGFFERAYQTSGLKGMVDEAKSKADEDVAVMDDAVKAIKEGRYGHAAEALLTHIARRGGQAALGPGGEMLKSTAQSTIQHAGSAIDAAKKGDVGSAVENAAAAVPVLGQVGEQIGKPLGEDIGNKNYAGVAGDVVGGIPSVLGTAKAGGELAEGGAAPEPAPKTASAEETTPNARPLKQAGERVQQEAKTVRDTKGKAVGAAKEAVASKLPEGDKPFPKGGALSKAAQTVLKDTADTEQLAGAKDPDMSDVRAMADHLSKGENAKGEPLSADPTQADAIKRAFDQKIDALQTKVATGGNATALKHLQSLKSAFSDDLYDAYEKYGDPDAAQKLRAASKDYAQTVADQTSGPAKSIFRNKSPEKIVDGIVSGGAKSQSAVESIVRNTSEEGKATLRDSVLKRLYDKSSSPDGTLDMIKARKQLYAMGDTAKVLFGDKLKETTDFLDAASKRQQDLIDKASKTSAGKKIASRITRIAGAGTGALVAGVPGAVVGEVAADAANDSLFQNGRSGAVKIGISPTERIVLSPAEASAKRPLITKFLKAKTVADRASAYAAITKKPEQKDSE